MFVDLHIHSCLSACADDDMTPNNIVNMAKLKGLDMIAITDHNSAKNQPALQQVAQKVGIKLLFGVEVCSQEEVHVLVYFKTCDQVMAFDQWLVQSYLPIKNNVEFYGHQYIRNEVDQIIGSVESNLSLAINQPIQAIVQQAKKHQGVCVYAHAIHKRNSVVQQLGFIAKDDLIKGIEVRSEQEKIELINRFPYLKEHYWYRNSDAHQLADILEPESWIDKRDLDYLLGITS